ncbi:MAG: hypothetical protein HQ500_01440 [Flavobacteriales bacterium]|nr:hypothetical protein [Flavobacteriales bacterium]
MEPLDHLNINREAIDANRFNPTAKNIIVPFIASGIDEYDCVDTSKAHPRGRWLERLQRHERIKRLSYARP